MASANAFSSIGRRFCTLPFVVILICLQGAASGQSRPGESCFQPGLSSDLIKRLAQIQPREDTNSNKQHAELAKQLIQAANDHAASVQASLQGKKTVVQADIGTIARELICRVVESFGVPTDEAFGSSAVDAFLYLVSRTLNPSEVLTLYPAIIRAYNARLIRPSGQLARLVDRTRLALGRKQLFGTQAYVEDDILILAPVENPETVDERRREFGLGSLREYEQTLQNQYRLPLIRSFQLPEQSQDTRLLPDIPDGDKNLLEAARNDDEIRISTALVKVDVLVRTSNPSAQPQLPQLKKEDFRVFDNGRPSEIEFFGETASPFDIVLLLDLSGSTSGKTGLIKKSTRRFIEAKRPEDRVAIVSFTDKTKLVSDFEKDPQVLLKHVKNIGGFGGSFVWDAFWYAMDLLEQSGSERRKAIVAMTDGVDNALLFSRAGTGSRHSFADLAERVSRENIIIFPVYIDTEKEYPGLQQSYRAARATLRYLADASGGNYFSARKLEDVEDLYMQALNDVGAVYTLGFTPEIREGDAAWHSLTIEVPSQPGLRLKYRPGYFVR